MKIQSIRRSREGWVEVVVNFATNETEEKVVTCRSVYHEWQKWVDGWWEVVPDGHIGDGIAIAMLDAAMEAFEYLETEHDLQPLETLTPASIAMAQINQAVKLLRITKPQERGELARRYAVTMTEMEKIAAYFEKYVVDFDEATHD